MNQKARYCSKASHYIVLCGHVNMNLSFKVCLNIRRKFLSMNYIFKINLDPSTDSKYTRLINK